MILLYIHLVIGVLSFLLMWFTTLDASHQFRKRYPNLKEPKRPLIDCIGTWFKVLIFCFFPLINIAWFLIFLFNGEEIVEKAINKTYAKCVEEKLKEDSTNAN